jgi:hypothetical protein
MDNTVLIRALRYERVPLWRDREDGDGATQPKVH